MSAGNPELHNVVNELVVSFKFELGTNVRIENGGWFAGIICRDIRRSYIYVVVKLYSVIHSSFSCL